MGDTMNVLQLVAPGEARIIEMPVPEPKEGEVLFKVLAVDTCPHWDFHILAGEPMFPGHSLSYPYTVGQPGHEAMGEVVAVGENVQGLSVGDRVVAWRDAGHQRQGCYAQFVAQPAENVLKVPPDIVPEKVTSLELAMCVQVAFDLLEKLDAVEGKRFGVAGLGGAGLVAVQMARASGAKEIIGFDPMSERRALAEKLGADRTFDPTAGDFGAEQGRSALDSSIDCTGLKSAIEFLMSRTREALALFGVHREDFAYGFRHHGLSILGYRSHNRSAAEKALRLILSDQLDLSPLVSAKLPLTQYLDGIQLLKKGRAIKVMFLPWGEE